MDETEAVQMAVRDLQHSTEHIMDKLEAEKVRLLAQLREKEGELIKQKEKVRELEERIESCSECVQKQKKINDLKTMREHQEKIKKSELSNLSETVKMNDTQIATLKDDNDSLRQNLSKSEEKCKELELTENSLNEKINKGVKSNLNLCKHLKKLKEDVDEADDLNEKFLKENEAIKHLVKKRFNAHIYSKHGEIRIRIEDNCPTRTLSDILSSP